MWEMIFTTITSFFGAINKLCMATDKAANIAYRGANIGDARMEVLEIGYISEAAIAKATAEAQYEDVLKQLAKKKPAAITKDEPKS
jgi:hypothetical protein